MPRVSVIMPVYNGARFVAEAIESVLAQTWHDWQLVVIDDGSTDSTPSILKSFSDPRIVTIRQHNQGQGAARNAGLGMAVGEYIAFLDADDLYLPNALADFVGYLDAHTEVDVVLSDGYTCDMYRRPLTRLSEHRPGIYTGNILEPLVLNPAVITVPVCTMTRHIVIKAKGLSFDKELVPAEDWDFWIHLARHAYFGYLDKLTCMYRIHQISATRTSDGHTKLRDAIIRGRLKILRSEWFQELSVATREEFFYNLLVGQLAGESERQCEVLQLSPFRDLSNPQQARILRLVATDSLLRGGGTGFARSCLQDALAAWPDDLKSRYVMKLLTIGRPVCIAALLAWQATHNVHTALRSLGRRKPKPVPAALRPVAD